MKRRPVGRELAEAPHHDADRDVAVGEAVAGEELGLAKLLVEHARGIGGLGLAVVDRLGVALGGRRADHAHEQGADRRRHHRELPVHPLLRQRPLLRIGGLEAASVLGGEVAHDRVRLPQREAVILLDGWHQAVGIYVEIGLLAVLAERPADIDALERQVISVTAHMTFCTFDDELRPQTFNMQFLLEERSSYSVTPPSQVVSWSEHGR